MKRLAAVRSRHDFQSQLQVTDRLSDLGDFGSNPGALRARQYVPDDLPDGAPLVVVLHGCTQTAAGYDHGSGWSRLADQEGFALIFPEQQRTNNSNLCFNWFEPGDTKRGRGEVLSVRQMVEKMIIKHGLDRRRVFITGLSAGGAMASAMLATYPEVFTGGAMIAGLPYGSAKTVPEAFDRMRGHGGPSERQLQQLLSDASPHKGSWPTISVWHGDADQTVVSANADAIVAQWRLVHGVDVRPALTELVDGHIRRAWCDTEGRELIVEYRLAGMGHGLPLAAAGEGGLGSAGPFMLEVGVSSTRHIASFWGIAAPDGTQLTSTKASAIAGERIEVSLDPAPVPAPSQPKNRVPEPSGSAVGIQKVIEDALRSAGLMR